MNSIYITKETLENAVSRVSNEITLTRKPTNWKTLREEKLWLELVSCILGSRVQYELVSAHFQRVKKKGLINRTRILVAPKSMEKKISDALNKPFNSETDIKKWGKYPFSKLRSRHIVRTCLSIYESEVGGLKRLLRSARNAHEARDMLIQLCTGIGPKQASLFLRNVAYCENLAIFDTHIIKYMRFIGLIKENIRALSKKQYLRYEQILLAYSNSLNATLAVLDFAIWVVMKVISEEREQHGCHCPYVGRN